MNNATQKSLGYPRLKALYAMLDGIPGAVINLDYWRTKTGKGLGCGTICCIGGWAAVYPPFVAEGLSARPDSHVPAYADEEGRIAIALFFGVSQDVALNIFASCGYYKVNHKDLGLKRIRDALINLGAISRVRYYELANLAKVA